MEKPICSRCKQLTYPERWCECDPRDQIADFLYEECVILMPDEVFEEVDG